MGRIFSTTPSSWEIDHVAGIRAGEAYQSSHDGVLPATPMWGMLERRYELNEARFRRWHPNVALMLDVVHENNHGFPSMSYWGRFVRSDDGRCEPRVSVEPHPIQFIPEPWSFLLASAAIGAWAAFAATRRVVGGVGR